MTKLSDMYWHEEAIDADREKREPHRCPICNRSFEFFHQLHDHRKAVHPLNLFED